MSKKSLKKQRKPRMITEKYTREETIKLIKDNFQILDDPDILLKEL